VEKIAQMSHAATFLTREQRYDVPGQDLSIALSRLPALPKSGFVMRNVRAT
jgi:fatty-acid peroxygenase